MRIGEVARKAGVTVDTVRFYERCGVLPEPERRPSGYRTYTEATIERIQLARELQGLGFTLAEVADALHSHDSGQATCESERWRIEAVLTRIEQKIAELQAVRTEVRNALQQCDEGRCRFVSAVS